jgi:hypothetical protein
VADAHATAEGHRAAGLFTGLQQGGGSVDLNGAAGELFAGLRLSVTRCGRADPSMLAEPSN